MTIFRLNPKAIRLFFVLTFALVGLLVILNYPKQKTNSVTKYEVNHAELEEQIIKDAEKRILDITYAPVFSKHYHRFYNESLHEEKRPGHILQGSDFHSVWLAADKHITNEQLFPKGKDVDIILHALATAKIVYVDILDIGEYESGTSEKWIIILEGGQKAVVKLIWEEKGHMKRGGLCNYGFEMAWSEIAAFHLHRLLDFRNTPYVTGRKINLNTEIWPVASPAVLKNIKRGIGNESCVIGKCYYCKTQHRLCSTDGVVEASVAYWIPRHLKLHTWYPKYMPFSTPRMDEWEGIGFNNKSYCNKVQKEMEPYGHEKYYLDLFDFAILDTLMYHFDSKHYTIDDESSAQGLTIRLDHGRAFCAHDKDDEQIFLAPITQCCTLRRSTYNKLRQFERASMLSKKLKEDSNKDPIAPVLDKHWYPAIERRLKMIFLMINKCEKANGGLENILI